MIEIKNENNNSQIIIGESTISLPASTSQGEKEPIMIVTSDKIDKYYYKGFKIKDGKRILVIEDLTLYDYKSLYNEFRDNAMFYIKKIAYAIKTLDKTYLDLKFGVLELYRLFFTEDGKIVILPKDLSYIISLHLNDEERKETFNYLVNSHLISTYAPLNYLSQLVYYSILGFFPYSLETVREKKYKIRKISFYINSIDSSLDELIYNDLSPSLSYQRKICTSNRLNENINSWLKTYKDIKVPKEKIGNLNENQIKIIQKDEKIAKRKKFLRKKGGLITLLTTISLVIIGIIVWFIHINTRPPYTKDFNQIQIVNEYYKNQNDLNYDKLKSILSKSAISPVENEILNLFVSDKMRQAYERIDAIVSPKEYFDKQLKTLPQGGFIYGVDNLKIRKVKDNIYETEYIEYRPKAVDNPENKLPDFVNIEKFENIDRIIIIKHKRGYYLIDDIKTLKREKIGDMIIKYENKVIR